MSHDLTREEKMTKYLPIVVAAYADYRPSEFLTQTYCDLARGRGLYWLFNQLKGRVPTPGSARYELAMAFMIGSAEAIIDATEAQRSGMPDVTDQLQDFVIRRIGDQLAQTPKSLRLGMAARLAEDAYAWLARTHPELRNGILKPRLVP